MFLSLRFFALLFLTERHLFKTQAYNYLCDTDRLNIIKGTWVFNSTDCSITNTDEAAGNVIWFGDFSGLSPDSTFNTLNSFTATLTLSITNGTGNSGLFFRAQTVSTINDGGQQYYFGFGVTPIVYLGLMNNGWTALDSANIPLYYNIPYDFTVVANGTHYKTYIFTTLIFEQELTEYTSGSFALRTYFAQTKFWSLTIDVPTMQPTSIPTSIPSDIPTSEPTLKPSFDPTSIPSNDPSFSPTSMPSMEPSFVPTTKNPSQAPTDDDHETTTPAGGSVVPTTMPSVDDGSGSTTGNGKGDSLGTFEVVVIVLLSFICIFFACLTIAAFWCIYDKKQQREEELSGVELCIFLFLCKDIL